MATKPQQNHAKSSLTAEEGGIDASGSSLDCLADLAVHKTIDLDTTASFESRGQAEKANADDSLEGHPEPNDQSDASEAIEDPQKMTLVQESTAEGKAVVTKEEDPVVETVDVSSEDSPPIKEVSSTDGVPVVTEDTDVNSRFAHQLNFPLFASLNNQGSV